MKQSYNIQLTNFISKANSYLAYKIGSLLIMVYYYSRKLVLPEYSFPARAVVNMMESKFKYNSDDNIITNTYLQYMTPHTQKELLLENYMENQYGKQKLQKK